MNNERVKNSESEINWILCNKCKHKLFYTIDEASHGKITICIKCPSCKKIQKIAMEVAE